MVLSLFPVMPPARNHIILNLHDSKPIRAAKRITCFFKLKHIITFMASVLRYVIWSKQRRYKKLTVRPYLTGINDIIVSLNFTHSTARYLTKITLSFLLAFIIQSFLFYLLLSFIQY